MSHLNRISFKNFRVFDSKTVFDLHPITFLTGPNSSGKSSILKALLLLKSNYNSDLQVLDFSGPQHNLGTFDNTLNFDNKSNNSLVIGLQAKVGFAGYQSTFVKQPVTTKRSVYTILKEFDETSKTDITIEITYEQNDRSGKLKKIELLHQNDLNPFLTLEIGSATPTETHSLQIDSEKIVRDKTLKGIFYDSLRLDEFEIIRKVKPKVYKLPTVFSLKENSKVQYIDEPVFVFTKLYEKFLEDNVILKIKREIHSFFLGLPIRRLLKDFSEIVDNIEYLEAVRANTKRIYTNDSQGTTFNELILEYRSREISEASLNFTNKWLKQFDIADELVFKNVEGVATTIYLRKGEKHIALADLGYGITQFLPILLKIALEEPVKNNTKSDLQIVKKLILLEEPETNLHPKLQSQIADFLLDAIKTFEVRFIIETHSEYIIRKIQILTAEKLLKPTESVIYYFNEKKEDESKKVIKIEIKPNGTMSNEFGKGFFDEATNLKFELLKTKIGN